MRISNLAFFIVAVFGLELANACITKVRFVDSSKDLTPEVVEEMKKQELKIASLANFMQNFSGQMYSVAGLEMEQTAKMIRFVERLDELQKDSYRDIKDIMKGASKMETAIAEYETMADAEIAKVIDANKLTGQNVNALRVKVRSKMEALNVDVIEISRQVGDFKKEITTKLKEISTIVESMNANMTAMARRLGGVHEETKKITGMQLYQVKQLTIIADDLTALDNQAEKLRENLGDLNQLVRHDLNQSSAKLVTSIHGVFDNLEKRIDQIKSAQDMHRLIMEFGSTIDRLHYLIEFRNFNLQFRNDAQIWEPRDTATLWSNMVLVGNRTEDTIHFIIDQLRKLVTADVSDGFAAHKSIFTVFIEGARRFMLKERQRLATSKMELQQMQQDKQTSSNSELYFVESFRKEVEYLQTQSFLIRSQALQIRLNDTISEFFENRSANDAITSTQAPVVSTQNFEDDSDRSKESPAPESEENSETAVRRRRQSVPFDEQDETVKKMQEDFAIAEKNHIHQAIDELTHLRNNFNTNFGALTSASYKKEPIFYMYNDETTHRLQTGYADIVQVTNPIRHAYVAFSKDGSPVPLSLIATPKRGYFVSGCRVCQKCDSQSKLQDKVNVQCNFRNRNITNFMEQDTSHEIYPRTDVDIRKSEEDMTVFAALKPTPSARTTTTTASRFVRWHTTTQKQAFPPANGTTASAVTGVVSVPHPLNQTVCGVIVGQPFNFDWDLASRGIAAITIEYCDRKTGFYLGRQELPKSTSDEFRQSYKVVSVNKIFTEWVQPIPDGWITGVGFSLTSDGALTIELHSRFF